MGVLMNPSNPSGFTFGQQAQTTTTSASLGSFSFGQSPASTSSFSLGNATQPSNTATVNPLTSTGFSFGSSTTAQGGNTSGFSFGQSNTNPSTSTSGFALGQTALTSQSSGGFSFGQQPQSSLPSTGLNANLNNQTSAGFGGFSFGQSNSAPSTTTSGLNFGLNTGTTTTTSAGGLGQTASTGFSFGQAVSSASGTSTTSTAATGLFSNQPTNATTSSTTAGLFAQPSSTNPVSSSTGLFNPSTPSTQGGPFGQTPNTASSSSGINFGLGSGGLFNQTSNTASSTGINFGTAVSSASGPGFNFSTGTTSSGFSLTPSSGGLGGTPASSSSIFSNVTSASSLGLGGSLPASSLSTSGGLGGFQTSTVESGIGSNSSKDGKSIKETPLPQDIFSTIAIFEAYKDSEKRCSEDNIRQTATPFLKLVEDTRKLKQHIVKLSNQNSQLQGSAQKLKSSVIQEAENVEMARRTRDTPVNLQGDNKAPDQFFLRLVRSFEERMTFCRNRIEEVEKCARSNGTFNEITSDDMKEVLKKEHDIVKMLAAKIYTLHNQLISYTNQSNNPDMQPDVLFKPVSTELEPQAGALSKNTSMIRPALGEGGSGLLNFQNGQQRAKAVSLGAAPPTVPLGQVPNANLLGSTSQSGLFSGTPNQTFGSSLFNMSNSGNNTNNNNNNSSFGFGSKPLFGANTSSFFSNPSSANQNQSSGGMFNSGSNASPFGVKSIKKCMSL